MLVDLPQPCTCRQLIVDLRSVPRLRRSKYGMSRIDYIDADIRDVLMTSGDLSVCYLGHNARRDTARVTSG